MDTFSVLIRVPVAPEAVSTFLRENGGYKIDGAQYWCIERDASHVYVETGDPRQLDSETTEEGNSGVKEDVSLLLHVTIGRARGSKYLALEIATKAAVLWNGEMSWNGMDQWESEYHIWQRWLRNGQSGTLPEID